MNIKNEFKLGYILIAVIIVVVSVTIFKNFRKQPELISYKKLTDEQASTMATEKYINTILSKIQERDVDYLYSRLSDGYILYNQMTMEKFKEIFNNKLYSSNISVSNVQEINYKDNSTVYDVVFKIGGKEQPVQITENYGNSWKISLDNLYNFRVTNFSTKKDGIIITIDSIYQTMDYVEMNCYIQNPTNKNINLHVEKVDSVELELSTREYVKLSNSNLDNTNFEVSANSMLSRKFRFNLDLENQQYIKGIRFNQFSIEGIDNQFSINIYI